MDGAKILPNGPPGKQQPPIGCAKVDEACWPPELDAPTGAAHMGIRSEAYQSPFTSEPSSMRYLVMTHVSPEDVIRRAKEYFTTHTLLQVADESADAVRFQGDIGVTSIRVDREHGHTNVHAETDRVVGLDVTDITKRFLYTLEHV
jgi:hypothetical protein